MLPFGVGGMHSIGNLVVPSTITMVVPVVPVVGPNECRRRRTLQLYGVMTKVQLVALLVKRDDRIRELLHKLRLARQSITRVTKSAASELVRKGSSGELRDADTAAHNKKRKYVSLKRVPKAVAREACRAADDAEFRLLRTKGEGMRLSIQGCMAVAVRRNLSNIATQDFGKTILDDISRYTVSRCEVKAAAAFTASCHEHFDRISQFCRHAPPGHMVANVIAHRADATNSGIWQNRSLCCMEVEAAFMGVSSSIIGRQDFNWQRMVSTIKRVADVLPVEGKGGDWAIGMHCKHMASLNCPSFQVMIDRYNAGDRAAMAAITWYCGTSDCGPDMLRSDKVISCIVSPIERILWTWSPCFEHQCHLIVQTGLKLTDWMLKARGVRWQYFSATAKLCNVWRDKAKTVFMIWSRRFGPRDAIKHAKYLIPLAKGGRWGSIHKIENRLFSAGLSKLRVCLLEALGVLKPHEDFKLALVPSASGLEHEAVEEGHSGASSSAATTPFDVGELQDRILQASELQIVVANVDGNGMALNEIAADEFKTYTERLGRWRRDVVNVLADPLYEKVLLVNHLTRGPLMHLSFFLKQRRSERMLDQDGSHLAALVCGKANQIGNEFVRDLCGIDWLKVFSGVDSSSASWLMTLAASLFFHNCCSYYRRVVLTLRCYPYVLLLLVNMPRSTPCQARQQVAQDILDTELLKLEVNTRKIRLLFTEDLKAAAASGILGAKLDALLRMVRRLWKADVRENERINKMVTLQGERCPNASLELLSARIQLKHFLGQALNNYDGDTGAGDDGNGRAGPNAANAAPGVQLSDLGGEDRAPVLNWTNQRPAAQSLLRTCVGASHLMRPILCMPERFSPALPPSNLPDKDAVATTLRTLCTGPRPNASGVSLKWATAYGLVLNRILNVKIKELKLSGNMSLAIAFGDLMEGSSVFIRGEFSAASRMLVQCEYRNGNVGLVLPLSVISSTDVLTKLHSVVHAVGNEDDSVAASRLLVVRLIPVKWDPTHFLHTAVLAGDPIQGFALRPLARREHKQKALPAAPALAALMDVDGGNGEDRAAEKLVAQVLNTGSIDADMVNDDVDIMGAIAVQANPEQSLICDDGDEQTADPDVAAIADAQSAKERSTVDAAVQSGLIGAAELAAKGSADDHDAMYEVGMNDVRMGGNVDPITSEADVRPDLDELPDKATDDSFEAWRSGMIAAVEALIARADSLERHQVGHNGTLSLVCGRSRVADGAEERGQHPKVSIVQWTNVDRRLGREAFLDDRGQVKYIVPCRTQHIGGKVTLVHPIRRFDDSDSEVIIPSLGVSMSKLVRPHLGEHNITLIAMYNAALESNIVPMHPCCLCGSGGDSVYQCSLCRCRWHNTCCSWLMGRYSNCLSSAVDLLTDEMLPQTLRATVDGLKGYQRRGASCVT